MQKELVFSGVGGQGILVGSQLLGHTALKEGKRSMYFSMFQGAQRGGVCECLVVVADGRVEASPVILQPLDGCLAMHPNSFLRLEPMIEPGGLVVYNTSIKFGSSDTKQETGEGLALKINSRIDLQPNKPDVAYFGLPATDLAIEEIGNSLQATLIGVGAFIELSGIVSLESALAALPLALPVHRQHFIPANEKALKLGVQYAKDHRSELAHASALKLLGREMVPA
jgi:2-oxoglutarate ferredoxin oxidoreductase subunit gamma